MARKKKGTAVMKGGFFTMPHHIWDSDAMRDCDPSSRVIFMEILRRFNGYNNGKISLSVREAADKANVSIGTANKKIRKLVEVGLIKITRDSGFNMKGRTAREFEITFHKVNNQPAKNTFKTYRKKHSITTSTYSII